MKTNEMKKIKNWGVHFNIFEHISLYRMEKNLTLLTSCCFNVGINLNVVLCGRILGESEQSQANEIEMFLRLCRYYALMFHSECCIYFGPSVIWT